MTTKGAAALIRLATNPSCEILGAMVMQPGSEKKFYERVVGVPYDREFGERQSSRRRGAQFEQNAYAGNGLLLRKAFSQILGRDEDSLTCFDMLDYFPGEKDDARIARLRKTRQMISDSVEGKITPDIIIQPQLLIPTKPGPKPYFFIAPDLLVRSPIDGVYLPADLKSFIVRENEVSHGDLARVRLQLGAQLHALRFEYNRVSPSLVVPPKGFLLFSRPNGLTPHAPRVEDIAGAVEAIQRGIKAFLRHRERIASLQCGAEPYTVVSDLKENLQDSCLSGCTMAQWCRERVAGLGADLGEVARSLLEDLPVDRVIELMTGTVTPENQKEELLARSLLALAERHGVEKAA